MTRHDGRRGVAVISLAVFIFGHWLATAQVRTVTIIGPVQAPGTGHRRMGTRGVAVPLVPWHLGSTRTHRPWAVKLIAKATARCC